MTARGKKATQREQRRAAAAAARRRRRIWIGAIVGVVVLGITALAIYDPLPPELEAVETFDNAGRRHLAAGEPAPAYNSSPATNGDHAPAPADCGIYRTEIPDEIQVHNLEHGAVGLFYRPDLAVDDIAALEDYARTKPSHILLSPRSDLSSPIVVSSWTRLLRLDEVDLDLIDLYYEQFAFKGPEVGVACAFRVDESS